MAFRGRSEAFLLVVYLALGSNTDLSSSHAALQHGLTAVMTDRNSGPATMEC
jgi:hypothetical protein